jgi:Transmembrane Fragile-X-F protein
MKLEPVNTVLLSLFIAQMVLLVLKVFAIINWSWMVVIIPLFIVLVPLVVAILLAWILVPIITSNARKRKPKDCK